MPADLTLVDLADADLTMVPPDLTQNPPDWPVAPASPATWASSASPASARPCGGSGETCCFGPTAPPPNPNAGGTGGTTGTCTATNLVCNGTNCVNCGGDGELCCMSTMPCLGIDICMTGTCHVPMSPPDMTTPAAT